MKWRVYYGDGTVISDSDADLYDLPGRDVQVVLEVDPDHGWRMHRSSDFYWHDNGHWVCGEIFGLWDYLTRSGPKKVLFGRTISRDEWQEIWLRATSDTTLPPKSGQWPGEVTG